MRLAILLLGLLWITEPKAPLEKEAIYLDERMDVINDKKQASYYSKIVEQRDELYIFHAFFINGELKMEGSYLDEKMQTAHGKFVFYYENGQIESKGQYRDGQKYGLWERFNRDGSAKAEKVYAHQGIVKSLSKD